MNAVRVLAGWLPNTVRASKNTNKTQLEYLEFTSNVQNVSRIWPDYFPIGCKMLPYPAFSSVSNSQHNRWTSWTMLLCSRLLSFSNTFLKEMRSRLGKERTIRPRRYQMRPLADTVHSNIYLLISYAPMAGSGEKEAVWTLRQTDGGAQSRRPTVLLQLPQDGACHV